MKQRGTGGAAAGSRATTGAIKYVPFFTAWVPEVELPISKLQLSERFGWTFGCLALYLLACQVPLFGIHRATQSDPLYWVRMIVASNRGTLMELGVTPLMSANLVGQLIVRARWFGYDGRKPEHQVLVHKFQKLLGLLFTAGVATAYIMTGMYGPMRELGFVLSLGIVLQVTTSGMLLILMDEMLVKGYGLATHGEAAGGVNLFIACNICERIVWRAFSPTTVTSESGGTQFEGAVVAAFHLLLTRRNKISALREALFRSNAPNIMNLATTVGMFLLVIYLQGFRVNLSVHSSKVRGMNTIYPVRLFYTSAVPIILQTAVVANLYLFSQVVNSWLPGGILSYIVGRWGQDPYTETFAPQTGLAYYVSPPLSPLSVLQDPLHALLYCTFVLSSCWIFARIWLEVSGLGPEDVASQLRSQNIVIKGYRESSMVAVLNRYIPPAACFGGVAIGALTIAADIFGAVGTGTGILLAVNIIHGYYEAFAREKLVLEM